MFMRVKQSKPVWLALFFALAWNTFVYSGSRMFTTHLPHHDLTTEWEEMIPLLPWTVVIYLGCYLFWAINYVIGCLQKEEDAFRFISAEMLAKAVCLLFFIIYPTTNIRPEIVGDSIFCDWMRFLYQVDAADNLFPSIHCLCSWFCFIVVRKNEKVPTWYKVLSFLIMLSICISTLTTKQHVFVDVVGGIAIAEICYHLTSKIGLDRLLQRIMRKPFQKRG